MGQDTLTTGLDAENVRLDRWLRRNFPGLTQGMIEKFLRTGQLRVDGHKVKASLRLQSGQIITLPPLPSAPAPAVVHPTPEIDPALIAQLHDAILYRDEQILVLNKPAGLAVQGGSGMRHHHLDAALDGLRFGADTRPRLVHRLDKDTSGVLVLGRTAAAAALAAAFKGRELRKCYWALVVGIPEIMRGRVHLALSKQDGRGGEKVTVDEKNGKSAVTWFRVVDQIHRKAAWLEMEPRTGRTHQLRVHCSEALHTPILGDGKYGGAAAFLEGSGLSRKLHLHARALCLPHPQTGKLMTFTAPLSPHMSASFAFFGLNERDAGSPFTAFESPEADS